MVKVLKVLIKKLSIHYFALIYFFVSLAYIPLFKSLNILVFSRWKNIHLSFNYADEFVKRGLIGSLFYFLDIPLTEKSAEYFFEACYVLFIFSFFLFLKNFLQERKELFVYFLFLFLLTPAGIPHFVHDIGRFDIINYSLLFLALAIYRPENRYFNFLSLVLILLTYFIHEASFFYAFPSFLLFLLLNEKKRESVLFAGVSLICFLFIMAFGQYSSLDAQTYFSLKVVPTWGDKTTNSHLVLFRSVTDNLKYVFCFLSKYRSFSPLEIFLYTLYFGIILAFHTLFSSIFCPKFSWLRLLLFSLPFWILPLFLVGIDYSRWVSLFFVNSVIAAVFFVKYFSDKHFQLASATPLLKIYYFVMIIFILFGPLGVIFPFPLFFNYLNKALGKG